MILIVEDDRDVALLLVGLCVGAGFDVTCVHTGTKAIEAIRSGWFSHAVIDIGLPDISGYEVAEVARREAPDLRLVSATGYTGMGDSRPKDGVRFDVVLEKPFSREAFFRAILPEGAPTPPG